MQNIASQHSLGVQAKLPLGIYSCKWKSGKTLIKWQVVKNSSAGLPNDSVPIYSCESFQS